MVITMPENTTFERVLVSQGTFSAPPVGTRGNIICLLGSLLAGQTVEITVAVKLQINSSSFDVSATATSIVPDPNPSNNTLHEFRQYTQDTTSQSPQ